MLLGVAVLCRSQGALREIHNISEFMAWNDEVFTSNATSVTANIRLMGDLVFDAAASLKAPLGGQYNTPFTGVFDGNGHSIRGLNVNAAGEVGCSGASSMPQ